MMTTARDLLARAQVWRRWGAVALAEQAERLAAAISDRGIWPEGTSNTFRNVSI